MTLLALRNVNKTYHMGQSTLHALDQVNLRISEGEFITVLGPSGSGKSTLLNVIGGTDKPSSGDVLFKGNNIATYSDKKLTQYRRAHIGFVFQFYNLLPTLTALENIEVATEISTNPLPAIEMLERLELGRFRAQFPAQLSGGQQQRVAIARALASNPDILLCDEPTGALDSKMSHKIMSLLLDINNDMNKTVIIITHDEELAKLGHRQINIYDGKIVSS